MNIQVKPFLNRILIITRVLEIVSAAVYFTFKPYFSIFLMLMPVYFFLLITLFHISLINAVQKSEIAFISRYMLYTGIKLFINLGIIIVFLLALKEKGVSSIIGFLFCYLFYTTFEVRELLVIFKKK